MRITHLRLANLRAVKAARFLFQPGFNLIVGVNGVGKTSVLRAATACLWPVIKHVNGLRARVDTLGPDDVRVGAEALEVELGFEIGDTEYGYLVHRPKAASAPQTRKVGLPREQVHRTPPRAGFVGRPPKRDVRDRSDSRPLAVLFTTNRAVPSARSPAKTRASGGVETAFADAFSPRALRLSEFADWMSVQRALCSERPSAAQVLAAFDDAVMRFLPGYRNLRLDVTHGRRLLIDRDRASIQVRHLSDGERGIIALVLDLTRRLAQANPAVPDPAAECEAVVLIDDLDLHLHPQWQRQIVHNLTTAFPRCQFIATAHSPQVIGEVEHDRIHIMADGEVYSPSHSFGVDSSRVLEEIMETDPRNREVRDLLSRASHLVDRERFIEARELLGKLDDRLGSNDPDVIGLGTLIDFMESD